MKASVRRVSRPAVPDPLRAVLDTNIIVRAILRPSGVSGTIVDAFRAGHFELVTSSMLPRRAHARLAGFLGPSSCADHPRGGAPGTGEVNVAYEPSATKIHCLAHLLGARPPRRPRASRKTARRAHCPRAACSPCRQGQECGQHGAFNLHPRLGTTVLP
jgi:hypothetical protein